MNKFSPFIRALATLVTHSQLDVLLAGGDFFLKIATLDSVPRSSLSIFFWWVINTKIATAMAKRLTVGMVSFNPSMIINGYAMAVVMELNDT
jgi:hypothetical protein